MANTRTITKGGAAIAVLVAVFADVVQFAFNTPLALIFAVEVEVLDAVIDTITAVVLTSVLGFNWLLMPTFVLELVPVVDDIPTWTGCVGYLIWKRSKEGRFLSASAAGQIR